VSIIRERVYDAKTLLEGNRDTMCHQYARTASAPDATRPDMTDADRKLGAELAVRALDDEQAFDVFCDWYVTHARPDWSGNEYFRKEWVREQLEDYLCRDLVAKRSGECPRIVDTVDGGLRCYTVESWIGRVCRLSQKNERIMSDVWATCFYAHVLTADGKVRIVGYGNDEFGGGRATVDADETVMAAYLEAERQAEQERRRAEEIAVEAARREREREEAAAPRRGRTVRVVRGRKVPLGTTGTVGWYGETRYGIRVGIDTDKGERVWTDANNVEVV